MKLYPDNVARPPICKQFWPQQVRSTSTFQSSDKDYIAKQFSKKQLSAANEAYYHMQQLYKPASTIQLLTQVMSDWPVHALDYQRAHQLHGVPQLTISYPNPIHIY